MPYLAECPGESHLPSPIKSTPSEAISRAKLSSYLAVPTSAKVLLDDRKQILILMFMESSLSKALKIQ